MGHFIPVRNITVMLINAVSPDRISHVWPVVLVETRSILQQFLVNIQDGPFFRQIETEGIPRNGEILSPIPRKPPNDKTA